MDYDREPKRLLKFMKNMLIAIAKTENITIGTSLLYGAILSGYTFYVVYNQGIFIINISRIGSFFLN